jgi:hypothetical protein
MGFVPFAGKIKVISGVSNLNHVFLHNRSVLTGKFWTPSAFSSAFAAGAKTASAGKAKRNAKLKANIDFLQVFKVFHRK